MGKKIALLVFVCTSAFAVVGVVLTVIEYSQGKISLLSGIIAVFGVGGAVASFVGLFKKEEKVFKFDLPVDYERLNEELARRDEVISRRDEMIAKLLNEKLNRNKLHTWDEVISRRDEIISHRDDAIAKLTEDLNRKNLPRWDRVVKDYLAKGEVEKAIESLDTDASDEDAAYKHIRKAELYIIKFQFVEAEWEYMRAVRIFPSFKTNFEIGLFYQKLNRFNESIGFYNICLNLATKPDERARAIHNLGLLQANKNENKEALDCYTEALKIYRDLAKKYPEVYRPYVATTLNNLGILHRNNNDYKEALDCYTEALKTYRDLAKKKPEAYRPDVSMTLNNLGILHANTNANKEALDCFTEALEIYRDLAVKNPDVYRPDVARTLVNLSLLYKYNEPDRDLSLKYAREAEEVIRMCKETPFTIMLLNIARGIIEEWG